MRTAATFTGTILGRKFETDNGKLYNLLSVEDDRELQKCFPGFAKAVMDGLKLIDSMKLNSSRVTYFNYRVQVWAEEGKDVDPTPPIRIAPANTLMDPEKPVSFAYVPAVAPVEQYTCPACGKELAKGEAHIGKLFDVAPGTQIKTARFVVCHKSADLLEQMLKTFREARIDELMNVNFR